MKGIHVLIFCLLTVFILVSCSGKNYVITSDYQNKTFDNAVIIIPDVNSSKIYDDLDIFTGEEKSYIRDILNNTLNNHLAEYMLPKSNSTKIYNVKYKTEPQMEEKSLKIGKDLIVMDIPEKSIELDSEEGNDAFILLIDNPSISIQNEEKETSDPARHYSVSSSNANAGTTSKTNNSSSMTVTKTKEFDTMLTMEIKYAVYDNEKEQVVYYGVSNYEEAYRTGDNIENIIEKGVKDISDDIISNSPFKKAE